jgi:protein-S-isoprenylcysteine O-methyltransferase Ste14
MAEIFAWLGLAAAAVRAFVVLNGLAVMLLSRRREIEWGRAMRIALPEPFLLAAATGWLALFGPIAPISGAWSLAFWVGGCAASFGILLFVWALIANRGVGTGHYTEEDQILVTTGPYALVRHPLYCAAVFVWLGLALTQLDWALLTFSFAYVVPAHFFYARDEEEMMVREFGASYSDYRERVHMLFPGPFAVWE